MNARFAHARPDERANLYRYAEYADWQHQLAERRVPMPLVPSTRWPWANTSNSNCGSPPCSGPGVPLTGVEELRGSKPVVYYQDSLTFNQFDWTGSMDQALRQIISGRLGGRPAGTAGHCAFPAIGDLVARPRHPVQVGASSEPLVAFAGPWLSGLQFDDQNLPGRQVGPGAGPAGGLSRCRQLTSMTNCRRAAGPRACRSPNWRPAFKQARPN